MTTPQTVQSFIDQLALAWAPLSRLTLVTLDCTPFHIGTSVSAKSGVVYSLGVLRLQASVAKGGSPAWSYRLMSAQRLEAALGRGPG